MPIIAPIRQRKVEVEEREALATLYPPESLAMLMTNPELIRNVAIVGHLHHGKTLVRIVCFFACLARQLLSISCQMQDLSPSSTSLCC